MNTPIHDISFPDGLRPQARYFAEVGDNCVNVDGVIELMRSIDTPQAKAMRRQFRRRYAEARLSPNGRTPEKMREDALFQALEDNGFRVSLTHVSGTMDGAK